MNKKPRLYDSNRWKLASKNYLYDHPLCINCMAHGRITTPTETDHIIPHKGDEKLFWDTDNWQPLCSKCHKIKTAMEVKAKKLPNIDTMPSCKVILVCGPIGSGRLDYAKSKAKPGDVIIDSASLSSELTGNDRHVYNDEAECNYGLYKRNSELQYLYKLKNNSTAYIILEAPTMTERNHFKDQLDATVVVLLKEDYQCYGFEPLAKDWWKKYTQGRNETEIRF